MEIGRDRKVGKDHSGTRIHLGCLKELRSAGLCGATGKNKYMRFPFLGRNSDSTGQKVMIARENVCREIEDNRLIAKCQLLRANRGLQVGSHAEDTAHFAQPEITAYFGAFETDRAALGRKQIRNPSSTVYDFGVTRKPQSPE